MIVICSQCQTQFNVPPDAIAQGEGRMVRCSQCGHEWLQLPEKQVSTPQEKKLSALRMQSATTSSAQHPQPSDDTAHYVYKAVALVLLVVVLIVGYHERFVLRHIPSLGRAYAALQFQNTENVSLYDIEVTRRSP